MARGINDFMKVIFERERLDLCVKLNCLCVYKSLFAENAETDAEKVEQKLRLQIFLKPIDHLAVPKFGILRL